MKKLAKDVLRTSLLNPIETGYWLIYGPWIRNPALPATPRSCLFICMGNVCRSVFAEHLAAKMIDEGVQLDLKVASAGLDVQISMPPPRTAREVAREFGVRLDEHRSKMVTREMLEAADMVMVMEAKQLLALRGLIPERADRCFLLPLFSADNRAARSRYHRYNIADPFGKDASQFRCCFRSVSRSLQGLFDRLRAGA